MKRKHSQEQAAVRNNGVSARHAVRHQSPITNLEKQYEELCRLRKQVRKAERRRKLARVPGRR